MLAARSRRAFGPCVAACILGIVSSVSLGCGDEPSEAPKGAGGSSGSSAGGSGVASGGSAGSGELSPISLPKCRAYCEHYAEACSKPQVCEMFCELVQRTPPRCAEHYDAFYECGALAEIDCAAQLGATPQEGCGVDEVLSCVAGSATGCARFADFDPLCEKDHPGLVAFLCTGEDDPGCIVLDPDSASRARCCPPP
jgi:hypothetical protein